MRPDEAFDDMEEYAVGVFVPPRTGVARDDI
jgi:hypothetical protein